MWLLLVAMLITLVVGIIMPQAIAKWALLAPIFIPLFLRLGIEPQAVLAAYRVADSPINIVTPIMAYFPLIVVFARRYDKSSGIGTVIALMLPYFLALTIVWTIFFVVWYLLGIPMGPGAPAWRTRLNVYAEAGPSRTRGAGFVFVDRLGRYESPPPVSPTWCQAASGEVRWCRPSPRPAPLARSSLTAVGG